MTPTKREPSLNRAIFLQSRFDSSSLSILTSLMQVLPEAGEYNVVVNMGDRASARLVLSVGDRYEQSQVNIDLASLFRPAVAGKADACGCQDKADYSLRSNGVVCFYVSSGGGGYRVRIERKDRDETRTILDSQRAVPAGGLFAITFVQPGLYQVQIGERRDQAAQVEVRLPQVSDKYRPAKATLVPVSNERPMGSLPDLFSGQSIVFSCEDATRIRAELTKPADSRPAFADTKRNYTRPEQIKAK
jgi:hypothetical protein